MALAWISIPASAAIDTFPGPQPLAASTAPRTAAVKARCLDSHDGDADASSPAEIRRGASWFERRPQFKQAGSGQTVQGVRIAFTRQAGAQLDSLPAQERRQRLERAASGLLGAKRTLLTRLALPFPTSQLPNTEILFANLDAGVEGYFLPARGRRPATIVVDAESAAIDLDRIVAHQFAHAVADEIDLADGWAEALALWTELQLPRAADSRLIDDLNQGLANLHGGLIGSQMTEAIRLTSWLAFSSAKWGDSSVRQTLLELASVDAAEDDQEAIAALRRTLRRQGVELPQAFADYQLWTLFTGSRDDGRHLAFASQLADPAFSSDSNTLPALSIQSDPTLLPFGSSRVRLLNATATPAELDGGLHVVFEGEYSARWAVDLILTGGGGEIHRLPLDLIDGRVETIVPLEGLREAVLLIRRLGSSGDGAPVALPYSYSAARESAWPFELAEIAVEQFGSDRLVQWETLTERDVVGFNLLRRPRGGTQFTQVNPVWIPAIGRSDQGVGYRFLDRDADPKRRYEYRIQAITLSGMTSHSETVTAAPAN